MPQGKKMLDKGLRTVFEARKVRIRERKGGVRKSSGRP
jgi:hypothetical protein